MRRNQVIVLVSVFLASISSCSHNDTEEIDVPVVFLSSSIKDTAELLQPTSINFDFPITASAINLWHDSIAVVFNGNPIDRHFVEFFNMRTGQEVAAFFRKGRGPGEFLGTTYNFNNDTVQLHDPRLDLIVWLPIDSIISGAFYEPDKPRHLSWNDFESYWVWPYQEGLLGINKNCFTNKNLGVNYDGSRFIVSDSSYSYKEKRKFKYDTFNAQHCNAFISYTKNRIVYMNSIEPEVELYDLNLKLLKKIEGPELPQKPKYAINDRNEILLVNEVPYSYEAQCHDEDYFYLTYIGEFLSGEINYDPSNFSSYIFQFDWDGNFIDSYLIDCYVISLSLSDDGKKLYVFGTDKYGIDVFNQYTLR